MLGLFWENSHWFLIIMIYIKWTFIIRIFTVVLLPEPKTGSSCPSSSKHIPCPGKILSRWWLFEGAWDYLCFAGGDLGTEAAQLAQALAKWLRSLSPALTWGLAKLEHFSMRTAMWPQLQAQRLSFTSWIAYNNGMLGYLGCVHCRGCFLFKNKTKQTKKKKEKKKDCFPLRCQIMEG